MTKSPQDWGNRDTWRAQEKLVPTRTLEKGTVTPQETESDSPTSVWELLVDAWANSSLPQGWGTGSSSPRRPGKLV